MNNFIKIVVLILVFTGTLFSKNIATVTAYNQEAFVVRDGKKIAVHLGMKLEEKDKLLTGKTSKLQIIFNDETIITIGKSSKFSIEEYFYEENYEPSLKFGLIQGAMRTITGKIGKIAPQKFKVKTKTATIGIRGTNFTIVQRDDDVGLIYCTFGAISVSVNGYEKIVQQGFYAKVFGTKMQIKAFTPKELKKLQKDNFTDKKSKLKHLKKEEFSPATLQSDNQIDTTKDLINIDIITKKIATSVKDAKQREEEEHIHFEPNQNPDASSDEDNEIIIDPNSETGSNDDEIIVEPDANEVIFPQQIGRFVKDTQSAEISNSHLYLDFENGDESASKMSLYLSSSNQEYESWEFYIDKPTSITSQENYTTNFSSVSVGSQGSESSSLNPRVSSSSFKATDDDLVSGDAVVWGEWDASILYDNSNGVNQSHTLSGLWIAGEKTESSVVDALTATAVTYEGKYKAIEYTNQNIIYGTASMLVDFGNDTALLSIDYSNGRVYDLSFYSGSNIMNGYQQGDEYGYADGLFYGLDGSLIGGNFSSTSGGYDKVELKGVYELAKIDESPEVVTSTLRAGWVMDYTTENYISHLQYNISSDKVMQSDSYLMINNVENVDGYSDFWQLKLASTFLEYTSSEEFTTSFDSVYMIPGLESSTKNAEVTRSTFSATGDDLSDGDYMSWGYWNASLSYENDEGTQTHELTGYWQSGEQTPTSVVDAITSSDVTYNGIYRAVDFTTQYNNTINGDASMNVDFGADRATLTLDYDGGRLFDMTLSGNILSGSPHVGEGEAYGAFYGPEANSVGGNFATLIDNVKEIRGVYQVTK